MLFRGNVKIIVLIVFLADRAEGVLGIGPWEYLGSE
jgi:hypothetical protein